jgi:hypothetical protein
MHDVIKHTIADDVIINALPMNDVISTVTLIM